MAGYAVNGILLFPVWIKANPVFEMFLDFSGV